MNMVVLVVEVVWVVGVVEVVRLVLVVGVFEEAKCPEKKEKRLTHFKTMPQAAGKNHQVNEKAIETYVVDIAVPHHI